MTQQTVAVIDYGMGNLHSVKSALEHVAPEQKVIVTSDPAVVAVADRVIFPGYVTREEQPLWYTAADVFVYPSQYEGFGLPPLEAMACGTPVVTSNVSSLPEVTGDAALLVDPTDTNEIADAMKRVLTDPMLHAELRARGLARAKQFSWARSARQIRDIYLEVAAQ